MLTGVTIRSIKDDPSFKQGFEESPETVAKAVRLGNLFSLLILAIYEYYSFTQKTDRTDSGDMIHFSLVVSGTCVIPLIAYGDHPPVYAITKILGIWAGGWAALGVFPKENIAFRMLVGSQAGCGIAAVVSSVSHGAREIGSWMGSFDTIRNTMGTFSYLKAKIMRTL